ncbi:MAG: NUDIX hydrolase [Verrucomicrobiota bacterium]
MSKSKRIAGVALLRKDAAALFQLRDNKPGLSHANKWVFPGGHCDEGESIEDAARREFFEETGYCAEKLELIDKVEYSAGEHNHCLWIFWALYDEKQPLTCYEGQELKFIKREDAHQFDIPEFSFPLWDKAIEKMP